MGVNRMDDLISRQAVKEQACMFYGHKVIFANRIDLIPSADRPKGEWVWSDEDASWKCGRCDCVFEEIDWKPNYNFCPNCGADMRGEEECC